MSDPTYIYQLQNVQRTFKNRTVLDIDRLNVAPGEILALVGPSGAGKSTLLRMLAFLDMPTSGQIKFKTDVIGAQWPDLTARRQVNLVFQRPQLLQRTVWENVIYGLRLRGEVDKHRKLAENLIAKLGLTELIQAGAHTLSGGEMQRVALARSLVLQPTVLLLDEATANLDPYNIGLIEQMVREANNNGTTVVTVTHNIFQARRLASRVGLIMEGRLVEVTDTQTFFDSPTHPATKTFVSGELVY